MLRGVPYRASPLGRKGGWGPLGFYGLPPDLLPYRASPLGGGDGIPYRGFPTPKAFPLGEGAPVRTLGRMRGDLVPNLSL